MAAAYRTTRAITVRGHRYERGMIYVPENEDEAMQLLHLCLIERMHPPDDGPQEVNPNGCNP